MSTWSAQGYDSRSAVVHKAVSLLRTGELIDAYEEAWQAWTASDEAAAWDTVRADGLES